MTPKERHSYEIAKSGMGPKKWYRLVFLTSEFWRSMRLSKLESVDFHCFKCGGSDLLQVHHLNYRNLFDCTNEDLQVLCLPCHQLEHKRSFSKKTTRRSRRNEDLFNQTRKYAYKASIARFNMKLDFYSFKELVLRHCTEINESNPEKIDSSHVFEMVTTISNWAWEKFTPESFRKLQSQRGSKRWKNHTPEWKLSGSSSISKFYRDKRKISSPGK